MGEERGIETPGAQKNTAAPSKEMQLFMCHSYGTQGLGTGGFTWDFVTGTWRNLNVPGPRLVRLRDTLCFNKLQTTQTQMIFKFKHKPFWFIPSLFPLNSVNGGNLGIDLNSNAFPNKIRQ